MLTTSNHGLRKPEYTDNADIADINYNTDKIDNMPVLYRQSSEPSNKVSGKTLWYDTSAGSLKLWNGSEWEAVGGGSCDFMLSDTEFEANLADEDWCERFFSSRFALSTIGSGLYFDYWWDKIFASETALAFVADSSIATKIVVAAEDLRDTVFDSPDILNIFLDSDAGYSELIADDSVFDSLLQNPTALQTYLLHSRYSLSSSRTEKIWLNGTPQPPHTYTSSNGGVYSSIVDGYTSGGKALLIKNEGGAALGEFAWTIDVDLSNISQLSIYTKLERYATINRLVVRIDGTDLLNTNSNHSWTDRTFDVSSYSGVKTLSLALYNSNSATSSSYYSRCWFSDLRLVKS